ncbi:MAG TPA: molybdenum cofactor guanylyltransferase [Sandaracinaceae bacterium LLY-WYZ-13_1]|nr:molybdenum cofactor guanylyltransferase [Sandaracinaceae bacterium LLY-WYZ-13_1]
MSRAVVAGVFVGGASRRMGGRPKGLLPAEDGTPLVERWRRLLAGELGLEVALVGRHPAYAHVDLPQLTDEPPGIGPLGGLAALLRHAGERRALAVACDMPFVDARDVETLLCAGPSAAPRRDGRWEPLCAVYDPASARPLVDARIAAGRHSLQGLLDALAPAEVELPSRHLDDWDRPEDLRPGSAEPS